MPEGEVVIKTVLDLSGSEQKLQRDIEKALSSPAAQTAAKNAGKKIGDSLGAGIETTRKGREDKELAHLRKLEAIAAQSNARLLEIERRKQSQLDLIRERALQKEIEHQRKLERETQRASTAANSLGTAISALRGAFAAIAALGVVRLFENIARSAIDAAINIDRQVNTLKALTGSAEAAKQRFAELFTLAQRTPGLTTNLALTLDNQLRILDVSEKTINRILPAVGRLNAISPLNDPSRFVGNLVQLITQNFEKQDLRELVGNSPFAGQLIKELFNVDSPTNAKAIRESAQRLGINTVEEFFTALAQTAENNPKLQAVTESLEVQFERLNDRITVALAPIGDELLKTILPAFKELVEILERDAPKITALLQDNKEELLLVAAAFVTVADSVGRLIGEFRKLDQQFGIVRALAIIGVSITNPGGITNLTDMFRRADAKAPVLSNFESAVRPSGEALRLRAIGSGDLLGLQRANEIIAQEEAQARRDGGGLGPSGGGEASRAAKERAKQIEELKKKIFGEIDKITQRAVDDLSEVEKALTGEILGNIRREGDRPDARRRRAALIGGIVERDQAETLRLERNTRRQNVEDIQRAARRTLGRSGASIGDLVNRGAITAGEAEALGFAANRAFADQLRVARELVEQQVKLGEATQAQVELLQDEIELYDRLGTEITDTERFMRGFNSAVESSGDIWERFGQNVSNAFRNVKDLFNGLKSAVLGFFNDLLGNSIQNIVRSTLGPLFSGIGGAFRTPSFAGSGLAAALGGGGGISAPPSVSGGGLSSILSGVLGGGGAGASSSGGGLGDFIGGSVPRTAGRIAGGGFNFNFGQIGQSLANAAPLLGLSIGASLGGRSTAGNILGAAGGLLTSTFISTTLGAPGALGSLAPTLFSNPITAIAGAGLLVGGILLGRAKQRKQDEEASGQFLTQALQSIQELAAAVSSGQILGSQAAAIFENQILGTFRQQISGLKTKSVVESRLTNQVNDLRKVYKDLVEPAIAARAAQELRLSENASRFSRQIPEFATGGTARGGIAFLHDGEKILNLQQQSAVRAMAGADVFERAGVPGPSVNRNFDIGGTMSASPVNQQPMEITFEAQVVISEKTATGIYVTGARTSTGQRVFVNQFKAARTDKELS